MKPVLIADSGGTRTDWCLVGQDGAPLFFEGASYHPLHLTPSFLAGQKAWWQRHHPECLNTPLYFFGAGCYRAENAVAMENFLREVGFSSVSVASDLHAAGWSTLGKRSGWVAILGTGSVLFEWENGKVKQIIGGKGYLEGDEGSGYYFGKLVVAAYTNGEFSPAELQFLASCVDLEKVAADRGTDREKKSFAELSLQLEAVPFVEKYHEENLRTFVRTHLSEIHPEQLNFAGSYACHQRLKLQEILAEQGIEPGNLADRPIRYLFEQTDGFVE